MPPYPGFSLALPSEARLLADGVDVPLGLQHRHRWNPGDEEWDEPAVPELRRIIATGCREAWEFEQVLPGTDAETLPDPILEAVELAERAQRAQARALLKSLLAEDVRCLDSHAHLGSFALDYSAALALPHFAAGVAIGERSLPPAFTGVLPWGWIDNRPFLRCLHGYALCLWRLREFDAAAEVLIALLWLNPTDNQGARMLLDPVRSRALWPLDDEPNPWRARGAGRRVLLDRAAPILDAPAGALPEDAVAPLRWLLNSARDGLPLTKTGALGRQLVRDAALEFPDWWTATVGPPHREADLPLVEELHALARRSRLLRRRGRTLQLTRHGTSSLNDIETLANAAAAELVTGDLFEQEVAELACALLLAQPTVDHRALTATLHAAVADTWQTEGEPVSQRAVCWALQAFLWRAEALAILTGRQRLTLTASGTELLTRALRHRATATH